METATAAELVKDSDFDSLLDIRESPRYEGRQNQSDETWAGSPENIDGPDHGKQNRMAGTPATTLAT
ncbi:hypothetical protein OOU_Y34scaffold00613g3 [Pyricularia oryzae Y34]|uniref:Uncharacterized protein n=2 Tax=Pyricularia oryzae TaxID=318829 RepID=A0AA97NVU1_PYRO3|nr:hypothetical protein OOU_Y34scaffold00613g3 [Pyricularia oryzae Y34]